MRLELTNTIIVGVVLTPGVGAQLEGRPLANSICVQLGWGRQGGLSAKTHLNRSYSGYQNMGTSTSRAQRKPQGVFGKTVPKAEASMNLKGRQRSFCVLAEPLPRDPNTSLFLPLAEKQTPHTPCGPVRCHKPHNTRTSCSHPTPVLTLEHLRTRSQVVNMHVLCVVSCLLCVAYV
jgi:hypothetical protein